MLSPSPLRGISFFVGGTLLLASMDAVTKFLTTHYPVPLVVAARYVVHCLLMLAVLAPMHGIAFAKTRRTGLVLMRAGCLAAASLFFVLALKRMPVAEASAILFFAPLLVVVMAGPVLRERVRWHGWLAALAGFGGLLLIARPGAALDPVGVLLAAAGAVVTAGYQLLSRLLASTETTLAMLFHTALVGALAFGAAVPSFWSGVQIAPPHVPLLLAIGALAGGGHYLLTAAYRHAHASTLAPLQYVQLVWAGLLGWLVFHHVPDAITLLGMAVVAASGAMVAVRSRLAARALERAAEA